MNVAASKVSTWSIDALLDELDQRYYAFAASLEHPLNTLVLNSGLFLGRDGSEQDFSMRSMPDLVAYMPWLFAEIFPSVSDADFLDIAEAGTLLNLWLILYDHHIDGQANNTGITLLLHQLYTAALRRFHKLFAADSEYWSHVDQYLGQHTTALLDEMCNHWGHITSYTVETMQQIGSGKVATLKMIPTALAFKAGKHAWIPPIENSMDAFCIAMQLIDDITDWRVDYEQQRYTLPLTQAIPIEYWPTPHLSTEEVGQRIERSVILEALLKQVLVWCQQARDTVADLPCSRWIAFIDYFEASIQSYQRVFIAKKVLKILTQETK